MKNQILRITAAFSLLMMLGIAVSAQNTREMIVTVPFNFIVGQTELPAGTYTVYNLNHQNGEGFMMRSADNKTAVIFSAKQAQNFDLASKSRIVFRRYENRYFLARVCPAGGKNIRELQAGRIERELREDGSRNLAKSDFKAETISITAR